MLENNFSTHIYCMQWERKNWTWSILCPKNLLLLDTGGQWANPYIDSISALQWVGPTVFAFTRLSCTMTGILKFWPKLTRPSKPINLVSLTFSYNFCVFMLAFFNYNFAYQMMCKSRRKKRGMIIFGQMFVIPAIVYSDDSYENLRNFFLSFASFFFFFFHPGMPFNYGLKKMFTMKPKVHSCGSEFWMEQSSGSIL